MILPNILTFSRMLLSLWVGFEYCRGNRFLAFLIFIFGCISDLLDGYIARRYDMVSDIGKLMDPLADKLMATVGLGCLVYGGTVSKWFLFALIIKEIILVAGSIYFLGKGIVVHSGKYGKAASVFFTVGIGSGLLGMSHLATGLLTGAFCCGFLAVGYYTLYFSN